MTDQHLHCHLDVEDGIVRTIHNAHGAAAEYGDDPVAIGDGGAHLMK